MMLIELWTKAHNLAINFKNIVSCNKTKTKQWIYSSRKYRLLKVKCQNINILKYILEINSCRNKCLTNINYGRSRDVSNNMQYNFGKIHFKGKRQQIFEPRNFTPQYYVSLILYTYSKRRKGNLWYMTWPLLWTVSGRHSRSILLGSIQHLFERPWFLP